MASYKNGLGGKEVGEIRGIVRQKKKPDSKEAYIYVPASECEGLLGINDIVSVKLVKKADPIQAGGGELAKA